MSPGCVMSTAPDKFIYTVVIQLPLTPDAYHLTSPALKAFPVPLV